MRKPVLLYCFVLLLLAHTACLKQEEVTLTEPGYEYFPISKGDWFIYQVDSVVINDFTSSIDTFRFWVKENYTEEFTDAGGRASLRLEREYKLHDTAQWLLHSVWYATLLPTGVERVESNKRIVKLIFPIKQNESWDANMYTAHPQQFFTYSSVGNAYQLGKYTFDKSLTVSQLEEYSFIDTLYQAEIYAAGVGMVKKEEVYFYKKLSGDSGLYFTMQLVDYGKK
jgi:hypothetical protein